MAKTYLSLERLAQYDALLKSKIAEADAKVLEDANKYTDDEIAKITAGTTVVPEADHAVAADSASKLTEARKITLDGDATGEVSFDGSQDVTITVTVADDSHDHTMGHIDGLVAALEGKAAADHNHDDVYYAKNLGEELADTLAAVKEDVDAFFKDAIISEAAKDTLKEIQDYITSDASAAEEMLSSLANKAEKEHKHDVADINGLTATVAELNYMAGVTSGVQGQLDAKVAKEDGKSLVLDTEIAKLAGVSAGANKVEASSNGHIKIDGVDTVVYTHPDKHTSGDISDFSTAVAAIKVDNAVHADSADNATKATQDGNGKVIADTYASKATTLAGYGIGDAYTTAQADSAISDAIGEYDKTWSEATEQQINDLFA